jgi:hypothetical protein
MKLICYAHRVKAFLDLIEELAKRKPHKVLLGALKHRQRSWIIPLPCLLRCDLIFLIK